VNLPSKRVVLLGLSVIAGAAVLFVSGLIGWSIHSPSHHDVKVTDSFVGTLSNMNIDHNAGCVQGTGKHVCGALLSFNPSSLREGQSVRVASEWYTNSAGNGLLMLVIVPTSKQVG
jgi:hypothetical protein